MHSHIYHKLKYKKLKIKNMRMRRNNDIMLLESLVRKYGKNGVVNAIRKINESEENNNNDFIIKNGKLTKYNELQKALEYFILDSDEVSDVYEAWYIDDNELEFNRTYDAYVLEVKGGIAQFDDNILLKLPNMIIVTDQDEREWDYERSANLDYLVFDSDIKVINSKTGAKINDVDSNRLLNLLDERIHSVLDR